jgi:Protein of unknown function, DUF488
VRRNRTALGVPLPEAEEGVIEVYTSHWRSPLLEEADSQIISISRGEPRWRLPFRYRRLRELTPNDEAWAMKDIREFEKAYLDQLASLGADRIVERLEEIGSDRPVVCLCWERPGEFCHRRVLAGYIERETGRHVPELEAGMLAKRPDAPQQALFD